MGTVDIDGMTNPNAYPGGVVTFDVTVDGERLTDLVVRLYDEPGSTLLGTSVLMANELPKSQGPGTKRWQTIFPALTPGMAYKLIITRAGTVTSSGTPTPWQRKFRHSVGEAIYPVSLGTSPQQPQLTGGGAYVWFKAATGPLPGDATGSWSTAMPTTFGSPAYLHIKVRIRGNTTLSKMVLAWRAT